MNNINDFTPGTRVRSLESKGDIGTVDRIDEDEGMVWVRFRAADDSRDDLLDMDPDDLEILR